MAFLHLGIDVYRIVDHRPIPMGRILIRYLVSKARWVIRAVGPRVGASIALHIPADIIVSDSNDDIGSVHFVSVFIFCIALFFLFFWFHPSGLCRPLFRLGRSSNCLPAFGPDSPEILLNRLVHSCLFSLPADRSKQPQHWRKSKMKIPTLNRVSRTETVAWRSQAKRFRYSFS
jgi:hypothetical protein